MRMLMIARKVMAAVLVVAWCGVALGQGARVAVVMDNSGYKAKGPSDMGLVKASANAFTEALAPLGFTVERFTDFNAAGIAGIREKLSNTGPECEIILVYFAGRVSTDGVKHALMPVDAADTAPSSGLLLDDVFAGARSNKDAAIIVIVDAVSLLQSESTPDTISSLATYLTPSGSIAALSIARTWAAGMPTKKGQAPLLLFTQAVIPFLQTPRMDVLEAFSRAKETSENALSSRHEVWLSNSLGRPLVLANSATALAGLEISVNTGLAKVMVNGDDRGVASVGTPLVLPGLPAGDYEVTVGAAGYVGQTKKVSLAENTLEKVPFELAKNADSPEAMAKNAPAKPAAQPGEEKAPRGGGGGGGAPAAAKKDQAPGKDMSSELQELGKKAALDTSGNPASQDEFIDAVVEKLQKQRSTPAPQPQPAAPAAPSAPSAPGSATACTLRVSADVPEAVISFDKVNMGPVGAQPLIFVNVPAGWHDISATAPNLPTQTQRVLLEGKDPVAVTFTFLKPQAPAPAPVFTSSAPAAPTPAPAPVAPMPAATPVAPTPAPAPAPVAVALPATDPTPVPAPVVAPPQPAAMAPAQPVSQTAAATPGAAPAQQPSAAMLLAGGAAAPAAVPQGTGALELTANVENAQVIVNGAPRGAAGPKSPLLVPDLPAGNAEVTVTAPGYRTTTLPVPVAPGKSSKKSIKLSKASASDMRAGSGSQKNNTGLDKAGKVIDMSTKVAGAASGFGGGGSGGGGAGALGGILGSVGGGLGGGANPMKMMGGMPMGGGGKSGSSNMSPEQGLQMLQSVQQMAKATSGGTAAPTAAANAAPAVAPDEAVRQLQTQGMTNGAPLPAIAANARLAGKSRALLIDVSQYAGGGLPHAAISARLLAQQLQRLGFEIEVSSGASLKDMRRALDTFARNARGAATALVYVTGLGLKHAGGAYLVPAGAAVTQERDIKKACLHDEEIFEKLSKVQATLKFVLWDTGLEDPFSQNLATPTTDPKGASVIYAAGPGQPLLAPAGNQPTFLATAFLSHIVTPGLAPADLFQRVEADVRTLSNAAQSPISRVSGAAGTVVIAQ